MVHKKWFTMVRKDGYRWFEKRLFVIVLLVRNYRRFKNNLHEKDFFAIFAAELRNRWQDTGACYVADLKQPI